VDYLVAIRKINLHSNKLDLYLALNQVILGKHKLDCLLVIMEQQEQLVYSVITITTTREEIKVYSVLQLVEVQVLAYLELVVELVVL